MNFYLCILYSVFNSYITCPIDQSLPSNNVQSKDYLLTSFLGEFTGPNITFIYPDILTGLTGSFDNGVLEAATAVEIIGERCNDGVKELKLSIDKETNIVWKNSGMGLYNYGNQPQTMDPHEKKSVYVKRSSNPRAHEGLFARRKIRKGQLVSFYGGERLFLKDIVAENMTSDQIESALTYTLALRDSKFGLLIDVTGKHRSISEYRTTLGHKSNHKFHGQNVRFKTGIDHPVLGEIGCLIAISDIEPGEEIFTNYNYELNIAARWYKDEFDRLYGKCYPEDR